MYSHITSEWKRLLGLYCLPAGCSAVDHTYAAGHDTKMWGNTSNRQSSQPRPFQDRRKRGDRPFGDGNTVDDRCRRLVRGVSQAEEFFMVTRYSVRRRGHPVFKTVEDYWRQTLDKHHGLFNQLSAANKDKFFADLRRAEKFRTCLLVESRAFKQREMV